MTLVVLSTSSISFADTNSDQKCLKVISGHMLKRAAARYAVDDSDWKKHYTQNQAKKLTLFVPTKSGTEEVYQSELQTWAVDDEYIGGSGTQLVVTEATQDSCTVQYVGTLTEE